MVDQNVSTFLATWLLKFFSITSFPELLYWTAARSSVPTIMSFISHCQVYVRVSETLKDKTLKKTTAALAELLENFSARLICENLRYEMHSYSLN
jgi:hypothetical protein